MSVSPQLQESSVKIYFSSNYGEFRFLLGNRPLDEQKIKRIKQDIAAGIDLLRYCPVLVSFKEGVFWILDGQHRFWVAKELKRPVHFVIADRDLDMYAIASMNSNTEKWKYRDFINCYKMLGNEHYAELELFMQKYKFPLSASIFLLEKGTIGGQTGGTKGDSFERGRFTVNHKERAEEVADACMLFKAFPGHTNRMFITAIEKIMNAGKIHLTDLAEKFNKMPEELTPQVGPKEYCNALEVIFNHRLRERVSIW